MADRRRVLRQRIHGPARCEHRSARAADLGPRLRLHARERELGRARLSARLRLIPADLRPALPDHRQEAHVHPRLRGVHWGERALCLCAGSSHFGRVSHPAGRRRGDARRQQSGGHRQGDGPKPARAGARRVRRRARGRGQRGSDCRRRAARDLGLALGVLDQRSLRADRDRRRLADPSIDGAGRPEPDVRLARRSPAHAGVDAGGASRSIRRPRSDSPRPCSWAPSARAIVLLVLFVWQETKARSPLVDLALLKEPAFLAGSLGCALSYAMLYGMFFLASFALVRGYEDSPSLRGSSWRSSRSASESSLLARARSPTGSGRASSASQAWRSASARCSR